MTDTSSHRKSRIWFARRGAAALAAACALVVAPLAATSAQASPWWSPVFENCGSKIVQLTFHVSGGLVEIGYNQDEDGVGNYPYWQLGSGTHTINTGEHSIWWEKWISAGDITKWSEKCVPYL